MTRSSNSRDAWGPCVWDRAKIANRAKADAMVSIHADGASSGSKGFFAMTPALIKGWTDDVVTRDRRLAKAMIAGMTAAGAPPSNYIPGQLMVSRDTTSLNVSNVPTVTVEVGNMRNAAEARFMSSVAGQRRHSLDGQQRVMVVEFAALPAGRIRRHRRDHGRLLPRAARPIVGDRRIRARADDDLGTRVDLRIGLGHRRREGGGCLCARGTREARRRGRPERRRRMREQLANRIDLSVH